MHRLSFSNCGELLAELAFESRPLRRLTSLLPTVIDISGHFAPERKKVEDFITKVYRESYGADIRVTYPTIMSVRNEDGKILAAVGFRRASEEPLFLEQYTREPIEGVMTRLYGCDIKRAQIGEIGNLASEGKGASVFLFAAIASYLLRQGVDYATVTGTRQLHRRFETLGLEPHVVCNASIAALESENGDWGTYYDSEPRVLAGSLEHSMRKLNSTLGAVYCENGERLFPRLHFKGKP